MMDFLETSNNMIDVHFEEDTDQIKNHSKNIIDLIEIGDYVNGSEVTNYYYVGQQKVLVINNEKITYEENENFVSNLAIKSVVTSEQFSSVEYVF